MQVHSYAYSDTDGIRKHVRILLCYHLVNGNRIAHRVADCDAHVVSRVDGTLNA